MLGVSNTTPFMLSPSPRSRPPRTADADTEGAVQPHPALGRSSAKARRIQQMMEEARPRPPRWRAIPRWRRRRGWWPADPQGGWGGRGQSGNNGFGNNQGGPPPGAGQQQGGYVSRTRRAAGVAVVRATTGSVTTKVARRRAASVSSRAATASSRAATASGAATASRGLQLGAHGRLPRHGRRPGLKLAGGGRGQDGRDRGRHHFVTAMMWHQGGQGGQDKGRRCVCRRVFRRVWRRRRRRAGYGGQDWRGFVAWCSHAGRRHGGQGGYGGGGGYGGQGGCGGGGGYGR